ncbi:MAG TPA: hypothetical protein VM452_18900 [Caulifigura sp.]|jgi:hypothetical protein|nr:hypothetical protein [Caulifigura sp.]
MGIAIKFAVDSDQHLLNGHFQFPLKDGNILACTAQNKLNEQTDVAGTSIPGNIGFAAKPELVVAE